jgi:hypothetical protein
MAPGQPAETGGGWLNAVAEDAGSIVAVGAEQVFSSVDGLTWIASPQNLPTEPPFFGWMADVVTGGPGFVAIGRDGARASVWVSEDGVTWSGVSIGPELEHWSFLNMHSVIEGGPGLVAVGNGPPTDSPDLETYENRLSAWVWTSKDGLTWARAPHDDEAFNGATMYDIVSVGDTLVAVGGGHPVHPEAPYVAAVWTSVDGISWQRQPHQEAFNWGPMHSVVPYRDGIIAVGGHSVWLGTPATSTSPRAEEQTEERPLGEPALTPVEWKKASDTDPKPKVHLVAKIGPLSDRISIEQTEGVQITGQLLWGDVAVELGNLYVRSTTYEAVDADSGAWFVYVGDIFELWDTDGLSNRDDIDDALDRYGPPTGACIKVDLDGTPQPLSHCAPLRGGT